MSKLLQSSSSLTLRRRLFVLPSTPPIPHFHLSTVPVKFQSLSASPISRTTLLLHSVTGGSGKLGRRFSARASDESPPPPCESLESGEKELEKAVIAEEYPSGDLEYEEFGLWKKLGVKFKMLIALPWNRVRKGSILTMKLRGEVPFLKFQ